MPGGSGIGENDDHVIFSPQCGPHQLNVSVDTTAGIDSGAYEFVLHIDRHRPGTAQTEKVQMLRPLYQPDELFQLLVIYHGKCLLHGENMRMDHLVGYFLYGVLRGHLLVYHF